MSIVRISGLVLLLILTFSCDQGGTSSNPEQGTETSVWTVDKKREWAAQLAAEGLKDQALAVYEEILRSPGLSENLVSGLSILIADIHLEKARYEAALASLFRAKLFPLESRVDREVEQKRILCFEKLGRTQAANRLLDRVTAPDRAASASGTGSEETLAEVGGERISRADFEAFLAQMPDETRESLSTPDRLQDALRGMVARRVLVRKAEKLRVGDDERIRRAMAAAGDEILVRKVMADEVNRRVQVDPDDVKLYFEANTQKFRIPEELKVRQIVVESQEKESALRDLIAKGEAFESLVLRFSLDEKTRNTGGLIDDPVIEGQFHPEFVRVDDVFGVLAAARPGDTAANSVKTTRGFHVLQLVERREGKMPTFEESKDRAESMLRREREEAALKQVFEETLNESDVKIHADRLKKP